MLAYFACEMAARSVVSQIVDGTGLSEFQKLAVESAIDEAIELVAVTAIFFVYRAQPRGEFFSLMLQRGSFSMPRIIPFYVADKSNSSSRLAGKYAVIIKPRGEDSAPLSQYRLGVPAHSEAASQPSSPGNVVQPLLARSVELQSY
jgi:hypothetical protein